MEICKVISIALSCFALGMSLDNLLHLIENRPSKGERKERKQNKKEEEEKWE